MGTYVLAMAMLALRRGSAGKRGGEFDRGLAAAAVVALNALALMSLGREIGDYYGRQIPAGPRGFASWSAALAVGRHRLLIAEYLAIPAC